MSWGIQPPEGTTPRARWGARTIYSDYRFDIVWDRMHCEGKNPDRTLLSRWLDSEGLPELHKLVATARLPQNSAEQIELTGDGFRLVASPRRSYGYLYIGAWTDPDAKKADLGDPS